MPLIFSYGSLQERDVQLSTFGRLLDGRRDALVGFELSRLQIDDARRAAEIGRTHHANVIFTGRPDTCVEGTVFELTDDELAVADRHERIDRYERIEGRVASGQPVWVYRAMRRETT